MNELRFPVGPFVKPILVTPELIDQWIQEIADFPIQLRSEIEGMSEQQLNTSYRPGGWKARQVVHHCADSHMNSFIRFKLALTEDSPTIKPYFEERWAELPDSTNASIQASLRIIEGLHARWVTLLKSLDEADFKKTFFHPEHKRTFTLAETTAMYAWHSRHHLAHIKLVSGMC